jgi:nitroreductase/FMN reductase [NAD(P)H]
MSAPDHTEAARARLSKAFDRRFGDAAPLPDAACVPAIALLAEHRTHRYYDGRPVDPALLSALCAAALSAPSKSDLQQRDIVIVEDKDVRRRLDALIPGMDWLPAAPALVVVCANNRRQRQLHQWRGHAFANDHLDPFFNASTDAAIVLGWLVLAAEAVGQRPARPAGPCVPLCRAGARLAVARGRHHAAPAACDHAAYRPLRRARGAREDRGL